MKKGVIWVVLTLVFGALSVILGVQVYALSRQVDTRAVVATVNGEPITKADLYKEMVAVTGKPVLRELIDQRLIAQEAKKQGIKVTRDDVQAELARIRKNFSSELEFQAFLAQSGISQERLEVAVEKTVMLRRLVEPQAKARVTDEAVKKYFEEHRSRYDTEEKVRARHILLPTRQEAEAVLAQLRNGADFAQLAKEKSVDTQSGRNGGDLGLFGRGQMDPTFEQVAFSLPVGQISDVVQTPFGFHIVQVTEHQQAKPANFDMVKDRVKEDFLQEQIQELMRQWLDEHRAKARITNTLEPEEQQPAPPASPSGQPTSPPGQPAPPPAGGSGAGAGPSPGTQGGGS